jgi:molybdate transport system substrate-binding protein
VTRAPLLRRALALAAAALVAAAPAAPRAAAAEVVVFAAASLRTALDAAAAAWTAETGTAVSVSYAGTAALAKQIEQGAPADLFLSADVPWMDWLDGRGLIRPGTRRDLFGNRLALVAHDPAAPPVALARPLDLAVLLGADGRLAIADVAAVPAGRYGRAALEALGAWDAVADRLAPAPNVRAALALVARGEAPYGVVYATDAAADPSVTVVGTFPADSHPPIVYPAALTAAGRSPDAAAFLDWLSGGAARPVFAAQGFTFPD